MSASPRQLEAFHLLLSHLRRIVRHRERSGLDNALLLATRALFGVTQGILSRVIKHNDVLKTTPSARIVGDEVKMHVPRQQSFHHARPLSDDPDYKRSYEENRMVCVQVASTWRYVVPIFRHGIPYAMLELEASDPLSEIEISLLEQLLELFSDHLSLIDYAETDTLTGLRNRKTFDESLDRLLANANEDANNFGAASPSRRMSKEGACTWLAVADIDHFKRINDAHGHIIGDEVLILVAQLMRETFRFGDQLFRFGGEEFVIVLLPTTKSEALAVLERFRRTIETHEFPIIGHVTVSLGVTRVDGMDTPTELVGRADQALYCAKENGRNRVESFESLHDAGRIHDPVICKPAAELF